VGRQGGGVFPAYCGGYRARTRLWHSVGARSSSAGRKGHRERESRAWAGRPAVGHVGGLSQLYAARTNRSRTGQRDVRRTPPGTSTLWDDFGEGSLGPLVPARTRLSGQRDRDLAPPGPRRLSLSCRPHEGRALPRGRRRRSGLERA
jgi:hypothetical protein